MRRSSVDAGEKSALYRVARGLNRLVNIVAIILFALLLFYGGYSLWYNKSLQKQSFLPDEIARFEPDGTNPSFGELQKVNGDTVAWIHVNDTNINYPVVQGKDDYEYLNKSFQGEFSLAGAVYLSASNAPDFSDPYNMVYGHHIEGGAMFSDVLEFLDASFFEEHREGILWRPGKDGRDAADRIEFFASLMIDGGDGVINAAPSSVKPADLPGTVDYILEKAAQKRGVEIDSSSRVIGLYTCENAVSLNRALLFGKLIPMSEEEIQEYSDVRRDPAAASS